MNVEKIMIPTLISYTKKVDILLIVNEEQYSITYRFISM